MTTEWPKFLSKDFSYKFVCGMFTINFTEFHAQCTERFGKIFDRWYWDYTGIGTGEISFNFYFKNKDDATLFKILTGAECERR